MKSSWLLLFTFIFGYMFAQQPPNLASQLIATINPRFDFFAAASLPYGMVASQYSDFNSYIFPETKEHIVLLDLIVALDPVGICKKIEILK